MANIRNIQSDLLSGLTPEEAAAVWALGSPMTVAAGTALFYLGQHADRLYLIERGRVTLTLPMQVGGAQEDVVVEERTAGETVGWSGLIPPHRFTLKAAAAVDSEVLALPRAHLLEHFAGNPAVAYTVIQNVAVVIGHRLQVCQTMWLREMQRVIELRYP